MAQSRRRSVGTRLALHRIAHSPAGAGVSRYSQIPMLGGRPLPSASLLPYEYCGLVGEYCGLVGLYCGDVGEYCGLVGLYCGDVGL